MFDISEIIENMYKIEIKDIRNTINKNIEYNVKIENSSLFDFSLSDLYHVIIIDRLKDQIDDIDDLEIIKSLFSPINNEILEDIKDRELAILYYHVIKEYLENKKWIKNDIKEYYKNYVEDQEYIEFIVFNINNYEITTTDNDNIGRYGSTNEVLIFDYPNIF